MSLSEPPRFFFADTIEIVGTVMQQEVVMNRDEQAPISTIGDCSWWQRDLLDRDYVSGATQEQCQSSCSSGNGGCSPSKVSLPQRRRIAK